MLWTIPGQIQEEHLNGEQKRLKAFKDAWDIYNGEHPLPLRKTKSDPRGQDNVILNFARVIVDKGVAFLFGQDLTFSTDDKPERNDAEKWLDNVWQANRRATFLNKLGTNGGVTGQTFLKIVANSPITAPYPRLVLLDPSTVTPTWDDDDIEYVRKWRIRWNTLDANGQPLVKQQRIEPGAIGLDGLPVNWLIIDEVAPANDPRFVEVRREVWPYPFAPILGCQNLPAPNEYWGISDLEPDIVAPNKAINFTISNMLRIIRLHAHPKTWGRGIGGQQLELGPDDVLLIKSSDGELHTLEMTSDLASSLAIFREVRSALHEVSRIPEVATGKLDGVGTLSGLALKILYGPLVEKTETKRLTYGDMLVELNRRLLTIGGKGEDNVVTIHWPEIVPQDPKEERETALLDQQLGVSKETLLEKLGYDPDTERQRKETEAAAAGEAMLTAFERGGNAPMGNGQPMNGPQMQGQPGAAKPQGGAR